ncbi:hypothetical protein HFP89_02555 [Wenzhouxiangella sp. XN79A]|uniref:M61 family metallopeptidase n=1 Tax=Wenzhouxiangella sp. XN79A TaxID=2724193 RepID=UPI00144A9E9E|nr:hypothetical protein [Wenzhouxiangella sp. XN79A]NKI34047.1 hypothetical protein [Wenzhouxiangella sp. XN79A]
MRRLLLLLVIALGAGPEVGLGADASVDNGTAPLAASAAPIRVDVHPPAGADGPEPWTGWIQTALGAVRTVSPDYPVERLTVRLRGVETGGAAVVFGRVRRSAIPALEFYVDPQAELAALNADWRSYHEAAHLLIPFPGNRDIWFTEGLASYYQYLLQARAGMISEHESWTELARGFQRGFDDPQGAERDLRSLSPRMRQLRAYRRVYWTGAAFFLNVDVRLRTETGGRHSLDSALAAFHRCCMDRRSRWDARSLIQQLGELSVPSIWRQEYQALMKGPAEPEIDRAFAALGIGFDGRSVALDPNPRATALRQSISAPGSAGLARRVVDSDDRQ